MAEIKKKPTKRATCPYCGKRVAVTPRGFLHAHNDPATDKRCVRKTTN